MSLKNLVGVVVGIAMVSGVGFADGSASADEPATHSSTSETAATGSAAAVGRAEASLAEYVFDEALTRSEQALATGGLSRELLGRALKVRAESLSALNRPEDAERAYAQLLSVQPSFDIDDRLGPRVRSPFFEARAFLDEQRHRPGLTLSIRKDRPGRVDVRVHDALSMVAKVVVHHRKRGRGPFIASNLPGRGGALNLPDGSTHELYVHALTPEGSIAFELGGPKTPMSTETSTTVMSNPPARPSVRVPARRPVDAGIGPTRADEDSSIFVRPIFWVIAGVIVTGAAATGIVIAAQ